jgi:uncharacterized membrane protein YeaQ/YmgE (transglycosylase-associated protein family)
MEDANHRGGDQTDLGGTPLAFDSRHRRQWPSLRSLEVDDHMSILSWIVIGLIAGWLEGLVVRGGGFGLIGDLIVGVVGALLGGWIASVIFGVTDPIGGFNIGTLFVAFVGAVVLVWILRAFGRARAY